MSMPASTADRISFADSVLLSLLLKGCGLYHIRRDAEFWAMALDILAWFWCVKMLLVLFCDCILFLP